MNTAAATGGTAMKDRFTRLESPVEVFAVPAECCSWRRQASSFWCPAMAFKRLQSFSSHALASLSYLLPCWRLQSSTLQVCLLAHSMHRAGDSTGPSAESVLSPRTCDVCSSSYRYCYNCSGCSSQRRLNSGQCCSCADCRPVTAAGPGRRHGHPVWASVRRAKLPIHWHCDAASHAHQLCSRGAHSAALDTNEQHPGLLAPVSRDCAAGGEVHAAVSAAAAAGDRDDCC
jgi:hypothetical protein